MVQGLEFMIQSLGLRKIEAEAFSSKSSPPILGAPEVEGPGRECENLELQTLHQSFRRQKYWQPTLQYKYISILQCTCHYMTGLGLEIKGIGAQSTARSATPQRQTLEP